MVGAVRQGIARDLSPRVGVAVSVDITVGAAPILGSWRPGSANVTVQLIQLSDQAQGVCKNPAQGGYAVRTHADPLPAGRCQRAGTKNE